MRRQKHIYFGKCPKFDHIFLHGSIKEAQTQDKTRGVSHCGLAIYIKKYLKAKLKWQTQDMFLKLKYFTMQKCNIQKIL